MDDINYDISVLAQYPFLSGALTYVKESEITTEELLTDSMYSYARELGARRVLDAIETGGIKSPEVGTDSERVMKLLSYPVARMLVAYIDDGFLIRRYALSEAKSFYEQLLIDENERLIRVGSELQLDFATHQCESDRTQLDFSLHFSDYVAYAPRGTSWHLTNMPLKGGYVTLSKQKFARVVQEALRKKIETGFDNVALDENTKKRLKNALGAEIEHIKMALALQKKNVDTTKFGAVMIEKFPPCMKKLLALIQAGENVSHNGRFAVTSFLHKIGMSADEIIKLFSTSPDFDESKTRYQVEHITGKISGTEYTPPECDTMRTYGICIDADSLCKRISHPLSYYSKKTITNKTDKIKKLTLKKFTQNAAAKAVRKASPP